MKVGIITKPNDKGQVVIPKEMRNALGINANVLLNLVLVENGIYIHPVTEVLTKSDTDSSYSKLLEKTQGAWGDEEDPLAKRREQLELEQVIARKKPW